MNILNKDPDGLEYIITYEQVFHNLVKNHERKLANRARIRKLQGR